METQFKPQAVHKLKKKLAKKVLREQYAQQYYRMVPSDTLG